MKYGETLQAEQNFHKRIYTLELSYSLAQKTTQVLRFDGQEDYHWQSPRVGGKVSSCLRSNSRADCVAIGYWLLAIGYCLWIFLLRSV